MKCSARRTNGEPCNAWAIRGGTVCRVHGGSTKRVRAAATRRLAEQKAEAAVRTLGLPVDVTPTEALLNEVRWTAGHVAWLRERVQELDEKKLTWGTTKETDKPLGTETTQASQPSVWYTLYAREREHLVVVARAAITAGVEERQVRLAEAQGDLIAATITRILDALSLTPEQVALVPRVVPAALRQIGAVT